MPAWRLRLYHLRNARGASVVRALSAVAQNSRCSADPVVSVVLLASSGLGARASLLAAREATNSVCTGARLQVPGVVCPLCAEAPDALPHLLRVPPRARSVLRGLGPSRNGRIDLDFGSRPPARCAALGSVHRLRADGRRGSRQRRPFCGCRGRRARPRAHPPAGLGRCERAPPSPATATPACACSVICRGWISAYELSGTCETRDAWLWTLGQTRAMASFAATELRAEPSLGREWMLGQVWATTPSVRLGADG